MARLWSCGFELQTLTAGVECSSNGLSIGAINTTTVRTGSASWRSNPTAQNDWMGQVFKSAISTSVAISRVYIRYATFPSSGTAEVIGYWNSGGASRLAFIRFDAATKTLQLMDGTPVQIGSNSAALSLNTWYGVELWSDGASTNSVIKARLWQDGSSPVEFASTTTGVNGSFDACYIGTPLGTATQDMFYDDWAINDTSGSFQTGYPGPGQIVHLWPNAAGDNNTFTVAVGGTAGAANNFTRVKEVTPDDATSYNGDITSGDIDDFNIDNTPSSIGTSDTINCIQMGIRFRALVAASESAFKVRYKKAASGTVALSSAILPNSTTWRTHAIATPFNYALTNYQDPDAGTLTKATLDTSQIGYTITTTGVNATDMTSVWMLVDSTPVSVASTFLPRRTRMGVG